MKNRTINVDYLARVEGEGALQLRIKDGAVADVKLKIFEPPRFFEAFLRGRDFTEAPDLTARICGICPVAYQMSAVHALESALDVTVPEPIRLLRRLLYCGEWIESHALHIYMLHAPDFLGFPDAIALAHKHPAEVQRGLRMKKAGNALVALLGGRAIHPINVRVGGFYRVPSKTELSTLVEDLQRGRDDALETVRWTAGFSFPDFDRDYEFVALRHATEYPFNEGRIVSNAGLDIAAAEFDDHFAEEQVPHSNALHCVLKARGAYLTGPLARYNLNHAQLSPLARDAARVAGLGPVCRNPFKTIVVRSVETLYAFDEALRIIGLYEPPDAPAVAVHPRAATGSAATEAPRGLLYHRYRIDADGLILDAKIVPPTSQNQKTIENDLREFVPRHLDLSDANLTLRCEQAIRNHDPCISCATHFLKLDIERE
jgi:coenzyme F420-reducing hydrogenase alpha subunit